MPFLIRFSGVLQTANPCKKCTNEQGIFIGCVKLEGHYGGACGNCKKQDKGANCEVRDVDKHEFRYTEEPPKEEYKTARGRRTTKPVDYSPADGRKTQ
jgi:hypothetical protein